MFQRQNPGYSALSRGRYSAAGEEYFLTFNLQRPQHGLIEPTLLSRVFVELQMLASDGSWFVRTGVVMPDHMHLLVRLSDRVLLAEAMRHFKGRLAPVLHQRGLRWQRSFFDHRMRHGEDCLPVFLYIFLNPWRAGLVGFNESWPGFICAPDEWEWFGPLTNAGTPYPEWLENRND
jgi:REP element-mobilizing transposase RayT